MKVRLLVASGLALLAFGMPATEAPASAAPAPKTSLSDIEDEVMCPICGTLLELADSPQARRQKVYIARLIAAGKTKAEIEDALVAQYGPAVLAEPEGSGFNLSAYLVPALALALAAVGLAFGVVRWRRDAAGPAAQRTRDAARPQGEEAQRLEADLDRYDL